MIGFAEFILTAPEAREDSECFRRYMWRVGVRKA